MVCDGQTRHRSDNWVQFRLVRRTCCLFYFSINGWMVGWRTIKRITGHFSFNIASRFWYKVLSVFYSLSLLTSELYALWFPYSLTDQWPVHILFSLSQITLLECPFFYFLFPLFVASAPCDPCATQTPLLKKGEAVCVSRSLKRRSFDLFTSLGVSRV